MGLSTRIITSDFPLEMQVDERLFSIGRNKTLFSAPRSHMLLFFLDVEHDVKVPGESETWHLHPNDACLFPANCARTYQTRRKGSASRFHVLRVIWNFPENLGFPTVGKSFIDPSPQSQPQKSPRSRRKASADPVFLFSSDGLDFLREAIQQPHYLPGIVTPSFHERIQEIRHEFDTKPRGYRLRIVALMLEICVSCARVALQANSSGKGNHFITRESVSRGELITRRTKEFLFEHHRRHLTLSEVAWHLKLSPEHLARIFKRATGATVFDYLRSVRVNTAQQLLQDGSRPIGEIGLATGFSNPTLFGRAFKQETGMTPQAYRQRVLAKTHFRPSVQI